MNELTAITEAAIELLRSHGWTKGQLYNRSTDTYCTEGAINTATLYTCRDQKGRFLPISERMGRKAIVKATVESIINVGRGRPLSIPAWNDAHVRDVDEVIDVLKRAGEMLDADR